MSVINIDAATDIAPHQGFTKTHTKNTANPKNPNNAFTDSTGTDSPFPSLRTYCPLNYRRLCLQVKKMHPAHIKNQVHIGIDLGPVVAAHPGDEGILSRIKIYIYFGAHRLHDLHGRGNDVFRRRVRDE